MKIIVGLGNPGKKYQKTRHNAGFIFLDELVKNKKLSSVNEKIEFKFDKKFNAELAEIEREGEKIVFVKPQTFMNLSGETVRKILDYYKVPIEDLVVVTDDIDLSIGTIRVRLNGSSGGHQGLESIIESLKRNDFARFRLGISTNPTEMSKIDAKKFVLEKFSRREWPVFIKSIEMAIEYLMDFLGKKKSLRAHTFGARLQRYA